MARWGHRDAGPLLALPATPRCRRCADGGDARSCCCAGTVLPLTSATASCCSHCSCSCGARRTHHVPLLQLQGHIALGQRGGGGSLRAHAQALAAHGAHGGALHRDERWTREESDFSTACPLDVPLQRAPPSAAAAATAAAATSTAAAAAARRPRGGASPRRGASISPPSALPSRPLTARMPMLCCIFICDWGGWWGRQAVCWPRWRRRACTQRPMAGGSHTHRGGHG